MFHLADALPHVVWTGDASGTPTYVNPKWTELTGLDLAATLEAGSTIIHADERDAVAKKFAQARKEGAPIDATYRIRRRDGTYAWHDVRVVPLAREGDRVTTWVGTAIDVDEQHRKEREQRFMVEATKVLGTSLDVSKTLADVARLVVPDLADWCTIDLLDERGKIERPAVAHVDPSKVDLAMTLWRKTPPKPDDPSGVYAVVRSRTPEHYEEISDALIDAVPDPEIREIVRSLGLKSSMCVPLVSRVRVLGAVTMVAEKASRRYTSRDLAFAESFAQRIALAVDNAQLYTEATRARGAAEAVAADVLEQSKEVEKALLGMQSERDQALARMRELERGASPP